MEGTSLGVVHHLLKFLDIINGVFDDVDFRHSLLAGSSRHMVLEVLVAVIDSLHSVSLPGVPPGHGHWDWRGYGVAKHWVVDHSGVEFCVGRHLAWVTGWAELDCTGCTDCHHCWGEWSGATDRTGNLPSVSSSVMQSCRAAWPNIITSSPGRQDRLEVFLPDPGLVLCPVSSPVYMVH